METPEQNMINNLKANTGKSLDEWIEIVNSQNFTKHGEFINYLKTEHKITHGFANLIAHKARKSDAGSAENQDDLITLQYQGKENLKQIYDNLMTEINKFGEFEIAPKNKYVSLRRKKQFAILEPATKTRFQIGLNMKNVEVKGKLEEITTKNPMCSHKININDISEIDSEIITFIKIAYDQAG